MLKMHSDGSHLSVINARSREAGYFFFGNKIINESETIEPNQGSVCQECSVIKHVVASAAECETVTLFINCQTVIVIRTTAMELGHEQPATPTQVKNTTTCNYVYDTLQQKQSKSFDMKLHWLRDRTNRNQFHVYWAKGTDNLDYYYSKHHSAAHEKRIRHVCICSLIIGKLSNVTTHHNTNQSNTATTMNHSQQPLSATMGVLLRRGL